MSEREVKLFQDGSLGVVRGDQVPSAFETSHVNPRNDAARAEGLKYENGRCRKAGEQCSEICARTFDRREVVASLVEAGQQGRNEVVDREGTELDEQVLGLRWLPWATAAPVVAVRACPPYLLCGCASCASCAS